MSNYDAVKPVYGGSIADVEDLTAKVHERDMKCIRNIVINHTSDEDELVNVPAPGEEGAWMVNDHRDPLALGSYQFYLEEGNSEIEALTYLSQSGRDNSRAPCNWDSSLLPYNLFYS